MEKKSIFLGHDGLTSTSANFIANLAKEIIREDLAKMSGYNFVNKTVNLFDGSAPNLLQCGMSEAELAATLPTLERVAKMKSLIGWLREGIKAKEHLMEEVEKMPIKDVCKELGIDYDKETKETKLELMTEEEYVDTLPLDERRRYEMLKTYVAVYGKFIHQDGDFAKARQAMLDSLTKPKDFEKSLKGAYITDFSPSLPTETVTKTYLAVQQKHRALQAELNSMSFKIEEAVRKENGRRRAEFAKESDATIIASRMLHSRVQEWRSNECHHISQLKIVIPQELQDICEEVSRAGK